MRVIEVVFIGSVILATSLVGYYKVQKDKAFYAGIDQEILTLLKGNIDNDAIFKGTQSFFGQNFYVNKDNLLQIDDFQQNLCEQLREEGYNCNNGSLVVKNNIDPMVSAYQTMRDAEIIIAKADMLAEIITKTHLQIN
jgi:hypothetical protein